MTHLSIPFPWPVVSDSSCHPLSPPVLRDRIRRSNPELETESPTFHAAMLLLSETQVGQNVDKLARFTGYARDFVARCARRLYDNGVWTGQETRYAWSPDLQPASAFWADVAVAEGRLCRRVDESGALHWAPAGAWYKHFDYVERRTRAEPTVRYLVPEPLEETSFLPPMPDPTACDPAVQEPTEPLSVRMNQDDLVSEFLPSDADPPAAWDAREIQLPRVDASLDSLALFPDAKWLG